MLFSFIYIDCFQGFGMSRGGSIRWDEERRVAAVTGWMDEYLKGAAWDEIAKWKIPKDKLEMPLIENISFRTLRPVWGASQWEVQPANTPQQHLRTHKDDIPNESFSACFL